MTRLEDDHRVGAQGSSSPDPDAYRRPRLAVLGVYVLVSFVAAAALGLPSRPYVILWVLGLVVIAGWRNPWTPARLAFDWIPVLIIAGGYDLIRSFSPDLIPRAMTEPQLRFDEIVFGGTTPTVLLQDRLVDRGSPHWWDFLAWIVYLSHFVVVPLVALVLYLRRRDWFHRYAGLIVTLTVCGFITYVALPAVPPWLASKEGALEPTVRVVHEVWANLGLDSVAKVFGGDAKLANPVAAVPSLHAGWPFMTLLFFWRRTPRLRGLLVGYNAAMDLVLVYGAEHYVSDILLGWAYAAAVYFAVARLLDVRARRRAPAPDG